MSKRLIDLSKMDIGLAPQSLASASATGKFYNMAMHRRILAVLIGGALAAGGSAKLELLQATDAAGSGAKGIPTTAAQTSATAAANILGINPLEAANEGKIVAVVRMY